MCVNISTFLVLHKACSKEKIKLSDQHKDFEYMLRKEWITQVENDLEIFEDSSFSILYMKYSGYVSITSKGKDVYFSARNSWIRWILGTIISISIAIVSLVIKALLEC